VSPSFLSGQKLVACVSLVVSPGGRFSKAPETFRARKAKSRISNLAITELVYSHILKMKGGSLRTRRFRSIQFSIFSYRWTKNGFTGTETFRGFRETGPRLENGCAAFNKLRYFSSTNLNLEFASYLIEKAKATWSLHHAKEITIKKYNLCHTALCVVRNDTSLSS